MFDQGLAFGLRSLEPAVLLGCSLFGSAKHLRLPYGGGRAVWVFLFGRPECHRGLPTKLSIGRVAWCSGSSGSEKAG